MWGCTLPGVANSMCLHDEENCCLARRGKYTQSGDCVQFVPSMASFGDLVFKKLGEPTICMMTKLYNVNEDEDMFIVCVGQLQNQWTIGGWTVSTSLRTSTPTLLTTTCMLTCLDERSRTDHLSDARGILKQRRAFGAIRLVTYFRALLPSRSHLEYTQSITHHLT